MIAPREVFVLEGLGGKLWKHSSKGHLLFLKEKHAQEALDASGGVLDKKWSIMRVNMTANLSSAPFLDHEDHMCDTLKVPANSIYLSDLRDQVAMAINKDHYDGDVVEVGSGLNNITVKQSPEEEYTQLRAKLKDLGVNVRAVRKLPRLREMLAKAEAEAVPA